MCPLIGLSRVRPSLWETKEIKCHKPGPVSTKCRMVANSSLNINSKGLLLNDCSAREEESPFHWLDCEAYRELRVGLDPELVVEDRARFLGKVIARRAVLEMKLMK